MKAVPGAGDDIQDRALCIADRFDHFVLVVAFDLIEVVSSMFPGKRLGAAEAKEIGRADPSVVVHPFGVGGPALWIHDSTRGRWENGALAGS